MTFTLKWDCNRERANRRDKTGGSPGQWLDIHCARRRVEVVGETLPLGDYLVFWYTLVKILIERKTWDDLAGSIKTGHLDEQLGRMQLVRAETGCTLVLLVEGRRRESHCHVESKSLQAKLDHIMFAGYANIIYTDSTEDTVKRIYEMIDNLQVPDAPPQFAEANKVLQMTKDHGPDQTLLDCFMAVPQLSLSTARILIDRRWNLWNLYEADADTLAEITYPSGAKMGPARAKKINKAMGERKTWVKILEQIQGVTKKTAERMFESESDLYKWTEDSVADVAKTEKSRVGPVVAARVIDALSYRKAACVILGTCSN
jgi:ERCC4-type nuclease